MTEIIKKRANLELSDNCEQCGQPTDLGELHIPSGVCESCRRRLGLIKRSKNEVDKAIRELNEYNSSSNSGVDN